MARISRSSFQVIPQVASSQSAHTVGALNPKP